MALHYHLFGQLRISGEAQLTATPSYRVHNLLALLLLRPSLQQREQLVDVLYPDAGPGRGRKLLSDTLYQLRQALPQANIVADRTYLCMPAVSRWLDTDHFQAHLRRRTLDGWLAAIDLYQGDLLEGNYESWLLEEREALRLRFLDAVHRACALLVQQQRHAEALPLAERLVREEPYDEQALRVLLRIYQSLGRRGLALQAYERFVALAAAELDVEPEPGTQMLAQTIRDACPLTCPPEVLRLADRNAGPDSLEDRLARTRTALNRGQRAAVESLLKQLQREPQGLDSQDVLCLEADVALRFDELARAARVLHRCQPQHLQTRVRAAELALMRRQWQAAMTGAQEVLLQTGETADPVAQARALWVVSYVDSRTGRRAAAYRAAEAALALARTNGPQEHVIDYLVFLGRLYVDEGRASQAGSYASEALALAQRLDYPLHYAQAARLAGWLHLRAGRLLDARRHYEQALSAARNVGVPRLEARLLNELAESCDLLGQSRQSLALLQQAGALLQQLEDPVPLAINWYNQAFTWLYLGDDNAVQAEDMASQAVAVFRQQGHSHWLALGLVALGYACWVGERHQQALAALAEAYRLHEALNEREKLCEILALQAQAYLGLAQVDEALASSRQAVLRLAEGARAPDMQVEVFLARAQAVAAAGDQAQAEDYLRRAYQVLLGLAADLHDEPARQAFFARDPFTRRLMREMYGRGLVEPPEAGLQTRWLRSTRNQPAAPVTWTVDAGPADRALKQARGAIALRRSRLQRMIQQAESQGVRPREADLAEALGVSIRTVQRDLAHLRTD